MPPDQLTPQPSAHVVATGVLAVLAGASVNQVANDLGMATSDLTDAIEIYQHAGRAALAVNHDWYQVHVEFPDRHSAESVAVAHLSSALQHLVETGMIAAWWFIRKAPCWRLRLKPVQGREQGVAESFGAVLDELTTAGLLSSWRRTWYEPETVAFGGQQGMAIAHGLFCADSASVLAYLRNSMPVIGRRELSVLLCTAMFRAAGQEWFETGDIWHRVARLRPLPDGTPTGRLGELTTSVRDLLVRDTRPAGPLFDGEAPLSAATTWVTAFHLAGQELRAAADAGTLERGTRQILAYYVIFHWNRLGLSTTTQSFLANAAEAAIFGVGGLIKPVDVRRRGSPHAPTPESGDR